MAKEKISVIFAAAECAPWAKVGGLGDVIGSLPQAIDARQAAVSVILPKYGSLQARGLRLRQIGRLHFEHDGRSENITVFSGRQKNNPVQYYFIGHRYFSARDIYASTRRALKSRGPHDNSWSDIDRFNFFSRAVVETAHQLKLKVDIIHCHDWHTALIPTFIDELAISKNYPFTKTVFTIHNLANQGIFPRQRITAVKQGTMLEPALWEDYYDLDREKLNCMKLGILTADRLTTVSPTYAQEVLTPAFGAGLEKFLQRRRRDLTGILNGIDVDFFNPATDSYIAKRYDRRSWLEGKTANQKALRRDLKLPATSKPLLGLVSRLVAQKGFDILLPALPRLAASGAQIALLGTGEPAIENSLRRLARRCPKNISVTLSFDIALAQKIYAGTDLFLMPSAFEPCGLGQMIAMRYGTVPIVRRTGGLADTVQDGRTGLTFGPHDTEILWRTIERSIKLYENKKTWYTLVASAMRQDFSWQLSAKKYLKLYQRLVL